MWSFFKQEKMYYRSGTGGCCCILLGRGYVCTNRVV